ncbi:4-carboxymuconolactone decarboxylase [Tardibacter chloracetimidivorans]|uniref:4-carboxymuconolactone decarboxylase n=1 Tax=Tardibacter chloracetimidivorans TaxID=1921510 RepID=A0A1L3ZWA3_9SPHN|nr:carboxymuconolactone decarboxylase family protein [Tardibacter chloracetimidivorans]API59895.1 4-carboxymuconolactone decarboxylase [Tardibacter chloracetimidivorans]
MTTRQETGRAIMREVIGEEYFQKREAGTNAFNEDARRISEEYCFTEIWDRPGLDRKTRSLLCLVITTALNRQTEFKAHVMGALNNGLTVAEIKEALLQTIIYCGLPAGLEAIRNAEEVFSARGIEIPAAGGILPGA